MDVPTDGAAPRAFGSGDFQGHARKHFAFGAAHWARRGWALALVHVPANVTSPDAAHTASFIARARGPSPELVPSSEQTTQDQARRPNQDRLQGSGEMSPPRRCR